MLLTSMHVTQPEYKADVWLIHSGLSDEDLSRIRCQCRLFGFGFYPVTDLERARKEIHAEELFSYVKEHAKELLLPDQDVLNALYGRRILEIDDSIWNYDARNYNNYLLRSAGVCDMDWVMENTAVLHFCGRAKPWQKGYIHRFGILYKHYMALTARTVQAAAERDSKRSNLST